MRIITVASLKGGVGKTTLAVFLSQALAAAGHRVLVLDMDPNNNTTDFLCRDSDPEVIEAANLYHLLTARLPLDECVHPSSFGLSVIPCTPSLHRVGVELGTNPGSLLRFAARLRKADADFVICDTPPAIGYELRAALHAADLVLSPVHASRWALQALDILREEIETVAEGTDRAPELRIVASIVTPREVEKLRNVVAGLTETAILKAAAIKTAGGRGRSLSAKARSWGEFVSLAQEIA